MNGIKTINITDKKLIETLAPEEPNINEIHLHLDFDRFRITFEEDCTGYKHTWIIPYFYKIKNILIDHGIDLSSC